MENSSIVLIAYAKLAIKVVNRGQDSAHGYHKLSSEIFLLDTHDTITLTINNKGFDEISIDGTVAHLNLVPVGSKNIIMKCLALIRQQINLPFYTVHLHKIIPVAAGLGGGSSDGAVILHHFLPNLDWQDRGLWREVGWDTAYLYEMYRQNLPRARWDDSICRLRPQKKCFVLFCPLTNRRPDKTEHIFAEFSHFAKTSLLNSTEEKFEYFLKTIYAPLPFGYLEELGAHTIGLAGIGPSYFGIFLQPKELTEQERGNLISMGIEFITANSLLYL